MTLRSHSRAARPSRCAQRLGTEGEGGEEEGLRGGGARGGKKAGEKALQGHGWRAFQPDRQAGSWEPLVS